jgi:hypothetical protein
MGKIAKAAAKKMKTQSAYYAENKKEMSNFGPATLKNMDMSKAGAAAPSVTRAPAPRPPQGSTLGSDAKNIKIRQGYEDIPDVKTGTGRRRRAR